MSEKSHPYDLEVLRKDANILCGEAFYKRNEIDGAVNWGDLGCTSAERREDHRGLTYYCVTIEEADPSATELSGFISHGLVMLGYDCVRVECEW